MSVGPPRPSGPPPSVYDLHKAVISCDLSRDVLLRGIDERFVKSLPRANTVSAQYLQDIFELKRVVALADGSVPMVQWLANAAHLASGRKEANVFERALAALSAAEPRCPPAWQTPVPRAWGAPLSPLNASGYAVNISGSTVGLFASGPGAKASGSVSIGGTESAATLAQQVLGTALPALLDNAKEVGEWGPLLKVPFDDAVRAEASRIIAEALRGRGIRTESQGTGARGADMRDGCSMLCVHMGDAAAWVRGASPAGPAKPETPADKFIRAIFDDVVSDVLENASTRGLWTSVCDSAKDYQTKLHVVEAMTRRGIRTTASGGEHVYAHVPDLVTWARSGSPDSVGVIVECGGTVFRVRTRGNDVEKFGERGWTVVDRGDPLYGLAMEQAAPHLNLQR